MDWHTLVGELDVGAEPADRPEVGIWEGGYGGGMQGIFEREKEAKRRKV